MGFGGAFVALADDATAAFANPAGLMQITRAEISVEGRSWSYATPFTLRGRVEGEPTGIGVDVVAGLSGGTSSDDVTGVSFLSLVYFQGNVDIVRNAFLPDEDFILHTCAPTSYLREDGLGFVYRSENGRLTIAFDWNRVEYSTILDRPNPEDFDADDLELNDGTVSLSAIYSF